MLLQIKSFSIPLKILFALSSLLILAQSATLPFIIDNESYYIQTIKWLNEYGLVKGLANLHLFFGQTSGWHITQAVYSLSFLYDRFNDLNGFCLLLTNYFVFNKLYHYFSEGNRTDLVFGLFPLTYIFLFQFVSSPSPDLPVYCFAFIIFALFLQNGDSKDNFSFIGILALYAVYIKVTAFILLLFPIAYLLKNFPLLKRRFLKINCIAILVFVLFLLKNTTLTGYPLFPLLYFRMDSFDYTVPSIIMDFFFSKSMLHSFYFPNEAYQAASLLDIIKHYFFHNGLTGIIGMVSVLLMLIIPFVIIKKQLSRQIWVIYCSFIILAILLCFSSPQYRFYIYFTLFFALLLISLIVKNEKWIIRTLSLGMILCIVLVFVPMSYSNLTENNLLVQNSTFNIKNVVIPEPNSKWKSEYRGGSVGNMRYHCPIDNSFFWVTGNGELPCINTKQLDYFQHGFFYIPQQRSIQLSDGFCSQKVSGDE